MEKIRVLLVEDDRVDQMAFKRFVDEKNLSYDYVIAGSVAAAKDILASEKFDVIIVDYFLGDGTGFDVIANGEGTPIIFVTVADDAETAMQAMNLGAYDYLIKDTERNYFNFLPLTVTSAIKHHAAEAKSRILSHAMENIRDIVYITDKHDIIIFVNNALCKTYGYKEEEILRKKSIILSKDESEYKSDGDYVHKRKDGSEFSVSITRSVLRDKNNNEIAFVTVVHDINS